MNKLITTAFLLMALANVSYGQTDFEETKLMAEQGDAIAQYNLGVMYDTGQGVNGNNIEALKWYRLAAEQTAKYSIAQTKVDVASLQSCIMAFDLKQQGLDILDIGLQVKWVGGA